jgi:hypothetical protein
MPIERLERVPSRQRPNEFANDGDYLQEWLRRLPDSINALEQSLQLVATTGTSTTSITVGTGTKALTTQAGKAWAVGSFVYLASAASTANLMVGQVTAYNATTGVLSVTVTSTRGSGTFAAWVIGLSAPDLAGVSSYLMSVLGAANAAAFLVAIGAAARGSNGDITALTALGAVPDIVAAAILLATAQSTSSSRGTMALATLAEVQAGADDLKAITPAKLQGGKIVQSTAVATTSGTSVTLTTAIPAWAKRVSLQVVGLSASGTSPIELRLNGETSGYLGAVGAQNNGAVGCENHGSGFKLDSTAPSGAATRHGQIVLTLMGSNTWVIQGALGQSDGTRIAYTGGSKALSAALTSLALTTSSGSETFDAGSVGVMWE